MALASNVMRFQPHSALAGSRSGTLLTRSRRHFSLHQTISRLRHISSHQKQEEAKEEIEEKQPPLPLQPGQPQKQRIVILGSGWAGYAVARTLDPALYERIIISPRSHFVFTPLLASTAVGTLEFRAVLEPVRGRGPGCSVTTAADTFHQGWADAVDFQQRRVLVEANPAAGTGVAGSRTLPPPAPNPSCKGTAFPVPYDKLIIAVGAYSQTFGILGVREHAHFLRDVGDARRIRLRVLSLFEQCAAAADPAMSTPEAELEKKRTLLHFAIVGGGPTGIEFAAELHDLVHEDLARVYPSLVRFVRITVYDVAPQVLPMFDRALAKYATDLFARQRIDVRTKHHIEAVRVADGPLGEVHGALRLRVREYGNKEEGAGMVVWSTGLMQNPFVKKLTELRFPVGSEEAISQATVKNKATEMAKDNPKRTSPSPTKLYRLVKDPRSGGLVSDPYLRARIAPAEEEAKETAAPSNSASLPSVLPGVFILGDCSVTEADPKLPKTAQVASQQAEYLGRRLNALARRERQAVTTTAADNSNSIETGVLQTQDHTPQAQDAQGPPFRFRNWGVMTYLGSWKAIHQNGSDDLRGWVAWVVWRGAYLTKSMSWRNRMMIAVYWVKSWVFGRDISRF